MRLQDDRTFRFRDVRRDLLPKQHSPYALQAEKVFLPKDNLDDLKDVPKEVKDQLVIIPVENVDQLLLGTGILLKQEPAQAV